KRLDKQATQWIESSGYRNILSSSPTSSGLTARFTFDKNTLNDAIHTGKSGVMQRESGQSGGKPDFDDGHNGQGLRLNGDVWLDLGKTGVFSKSDPFTISLWLNIPDSLKEGVIFHKSISDR